MGRDGAGSDQVRGGRVLRCDEVIAGCLIVSGGAVTA